MSAEFFWKPDKCCETPDFLLKPTESFSIKSKADRKMGTERLGNLGSSVIGRKTNDLSLFLSPFFCQPVFMLLKRGHPERRSIGMLLLKLFPAFNPFGRG